MAERRNLEFSASELIEGRTYRVVVPFADYDGIPHPSGEIWQYLGKDFLPYEDGLTLYVDRCGTPATFRLQWRPETQGEIISGFSRYVEEVEP